MDSRKADGGNVGIGDKPVGITLELDQGSHLTLLSLGLE